MFEITALPAFRDNYIWALQKAGRAVVVDPGDSAPVVDWLEGEGLGLEAVLITHHHQDHQGGVPALLARYPGLAVFGPVAESITGLTRPLGGDEHLDILGESFRVIPVPGHTRGHLAYLWEDALFCGDALFGAGCGRLFEGTPVQMAASLGRIAALPDTTRVFCAHEYTLLNLPFARMIEPGNPAIAAREVAAGQARAEGRPTVPSSLALEKATNPFLRCGEPQVQARARERDAGAETPVQVFAALRAWRDEF